STDAVEPDFRGARDGRGRREEHAHRHTFPLRVTHQAGIESVADAHQGRFLLDGGERFEPVEPIGLARLDEAGDLEPPEIGVHLWIDNVLRYAIELVVRRDRLNDAAFVLSAIVTEGRGALEPAKKFRP